MAKPAKKNRNQARRAAARFVLIALTAAFLLTGFVWGAQQFEHFLITDPRFTLTETPNLHIEGATFAKHAEIRRVFSSDCGRSIYLIPLAERRRDLLRLGWVREATLIRLWPNRLLVKLVERRPIAFVDVGSHCVRRWALIDGEGVVLNVPDDGDQLELPRITGVLLEEEPALRGKRVRRAQEVLNELGPLASAVVELDAGDLGDLKVIERMPDGPVRLLLGDRNFHDRLQHYVDHYPDIRNRAPNVKVFDLRLDERITAAPELKHGC